MSQRVIPALGYLACGLMLVFVLFWSSFQTLPEIIQGDTIWHLSPVARVMLVALASCASVAIALFCLVKTQVFKRKFVASPGCKVGQLLVVATSDFLLSIICLWIALGLAPQLFYALYVAVIPGLPAQWVVNPPSWAVFINLTKLSTAATLSGVLSGVLLWSTMLATSLFWLRVFVKNTAIESR